MAWLWQPDKEEERILPPRPADNVRLVFGDGQSVTLDEADPAELARIDGADVKPRARSIDYSAKGTAKDTAVLNLDANLAPWLRSSLNLNASITSRDYYQDELAPMDYAYKTSRAIPAYDDNGEYHYYKKKPTNSNDYLYFNYNLINELENSSHEQKGQSVTATVNLQFDIRDWLNAEAIFSYSTSHTTIEGWWGEQTYYAACLRGTEYGVLPEPYTEVWDDYWEEWESEGGDSEMPYGGELSRSESNNRSYTLRLQGNVNKSFGKEKQHNESYCTVKA